MDRPTTLRRTAILCLQTVRNFAFLEALSECEADWDHSQFWVAAHNNFLDVGILEWCKLFTEVSGKHHWRASVSNQAQFQSSLLTAVQMSAVEFKAYGDTLRQYRNQFLAHLDDRNTFRLPKIAAARASAVHLLQWLRDAEDDTNILDDAPKTASAFYIEAFNSARSAIHGEA